MIISFFREEGMSNKKTSASSRGVSWWKEAEIEVVTNMKSTAMKTLVIIPTLKI